MSGGGWKGRVENFSYWAKPSSTAHWSRISIPAFTQWEGREGKRRKQARQQTNWKRLEEIKEWEFSSYFGLVKERGQSFTAEIHWRLVEQQTPDTLPVHWVRPLGPSTGVFIRRWCLQGSRRQEGVWSGRWAARGQCSAVTAQCHEQRRDTSRAGGHLQGRSSPRKFHHDLNRWCLNGRNIQTWDCSKFPKWILGFLFIISIFYLIIKRRSGAWITVSMLNVCDFRPTACQQQVVAQFLLTLHCLQTPQPWSSFCRCV